MVGREDGGRCESCHILLGGTPARLRARASSKLAAPIPETLIPLANLPTPVSPPSLLSRDDPAPFVVLREGAQLDDDLRREIARRVRERCSPRHVPDEVFQIAEVPRTLSGKALEVPVKRILMGTPAAKAASRDSLSNPAALDWFIELAASLEDSD